MKRANFRWPHLLALLTAAGALTTTLVAAQANDELLIWTDAARLSGFQLYQKTHPNVKMRIVTVDMGDFPAKVQLFNKAGSGWPDVVFTGGPDQVATLAQPDVAYTADLTALVPASVRAQFAKGSLDGCKISGKLYCLRNDLAQVVLWNNAKLMKDFGYTVPKTWEEYQALGLRVAKEHPGYLIGAAGDPAMLELYLYASNCPLTEPVRSNPAQARVNTASPNCTRAAKMLDTLITAGAVSKDGPFDASFVKLANDGKLLMLPAASWFGEFVFKPTYKTPAGQLSAALPPRWAGESTARTYGWGGGAYFVSSHAKNLKAAADVAIWMATSPDFQADAPTFPAYLPAAAAWAKKVTADKYYANDIFPVFQTAAGLVSTNQGFLRYAARDALGKTLIPAVKEGRPTVAALPALQTELVNVAQGAGYTPLTR
ncbi:ABC transporter substrate-binding protein [Deinococcus sp.]|uniref:ABC transporter substrate-binding protein n=1 Tax=Deinococcus sp. TaxID=47478 RepID=UPI003CC5E0AE